MRISRIAGRVVRVEPTVRWSDAIHAVPHLEYVFAEVFTDDGPVGIGYSYTHFGAGSILDMIEHTLAPALIGVDVNDAIGVLEDLLDWLHPLGQGGVSSLAVAALDTAVWDLRGKIADLPLYKLLGARRNDIQAYGSSIDLHLSVEEQLARISGFLKEGYTAIKIKAGREHASDDVKHFRAVRELVGPDVKVMVDANQRWTPGEAIRRARLYEEFDLAWLEEPVLADNVEGHAAVKASMRFPLATGETVFSVRTCVDLVEKQGTDILQADIARVGGFTQWLKVAHVAEVHGVPMAPHYIPEHSIHALCAVRNALIVECIQGGTLTDFGLLLEPVKPVNGRMSPPQGPGLGLQYNPTALNDHTIARFGQSVFDAAMATSIAR